MKKLALAAMLLASTAAYPAKAGSANDFLWAVITTAMYYKECGGTPTRRDNDAADIAVSMFTKQEMAKVIFVINDRLEEWGKEVFCAKTKPLIDELNRK